MTADYEGPSKQNDHTPVVPVYSMAPPSALKRPASDDNVSLLYSNPTHVDILWCLNFILRAKRSHRGLKQGAERIRVTQLKRQ